MITTVEHPRLGEVVLSQSRPRTPYFDQRARDGVCPPVVSLRGFRTASDGVSRVQSRMGRGGPGTACARRAALPPQLPPARKKPASKSCARRQSRPARPYRSALPHHGAEVQQADDPCLAYEVGELYRDEQHFAEPFPDDASGAFARFRHCPRVVPYRSPRPFPEVPCVGRPAGRGAMEKALNRELKAFSIRADAPPKHNNPIKGTPRSAAAVRAAVKPCYFRCLTRYCSSR